MNAQETIDLMRVMLDTALALNACTITQAQYERIMAPLVGILRPVAMPTIGGPSAATGVER